MASKLKWHGEREIKRYENNLFRRLMAASILLTNTIKKNLSKTGAKRGIPSGQGEYPFKQLGHLRRNVMREPDRRRLLVRVGTNVKYGLFLELKPPYKGGRPWLLKSAGEISAKIRAVINRGRPS